MITVAAVCGSEVDGEVKLREDLEALRHRWRDVALTIETVCGDSSVAKTIRMCSGDVYEVLHRK